MDISDQFKIIEKLGDQAYRKFGSIYLVEDKLSGEQGVLKAVKKSSENSVILNRLKHEGTFDFDFFGLPKILNTYESESEYMVVRNFIKGIPLDKYWQQIKKRERHAFLISMLEQLNTLFNHLEVLNIVHCDIKPGNILIDDEERVHLIDFGLSLRKNESNERSVLFPLGYAAPELLMNRLHLVDQRSDLFALGVVIWRLYSGKLPLTHPNPSIFTNLQLTHPIPESTEIPRKIQKLLEKLSAKHAFKVPPNQLTKSEMDAGLLAGMYARYTNLDAFIEDLKAIKLGNWFTRRYLYGSQD